MAVLTAEFTTYRIWSRVAPAGIVEGRCGGCHDLALECNRGATARSFRLGGTRVSLEGRLSNVLAVKKK